MSHTLYPPAPDVHVSIDGKNVGALRKFSEQCVQELQTIRELGSSENLLCSGNGKKYIVELEYILPIGCKLIDPPADPTSLTTFFLEIHLPDRTLLFQDCVYESVQTSCEVGKSLICNMRMQARNRQCFLEVGDYS